MAWVIELELQRRGESPERRTFTSDGVPITVGRAPDATISIVDGNLSRRHCAFTVNESGDVLLNDLGSSNGTHVDGRLIGKDHVFDVDQRLYLGDVLIRLVASPVRAPAAPTGRWILELEVARRGGVSERRTVVADGSVWIGRGRDAEVSLPESNASRKHCRIDVTADGAVVVRDGGSTNGTFVNGNRVNTQRLAVGDKIYVGDHIVELAAPPRPA